MEQKNDEDNVLSLSKHTGIEGVKKLSRVVVALNAKRKSVGGHYEPINVKVIQAGNYTSGQPIFEARIAGTNFSPAEKEKIKNILGEK